MEGNMNGTGLIIFLIILASPVFWAVSITTGLVALKNGFRNAFTQIDVLRFKAAELLQSIEAREERKAPNVSFN
jgi:hypothetical protein